MCVSPVCQQPNVGCSLRNMAFQYYNEGRSWIFPCPSDDVSLKFSLLSGFSFPGNGSNLKFPLSNAAILGFTLAMFIT